MGRSPKQEDDDVVPGTGDKTTNITLSKIQIPPEVDRRVLHSGGGPKLCTNLSTVLDREDKYKDMDPSLTEFSNAPKRDKTPLNTKPMQQQILRCHLRQVFLFHTYVRIMRGFTWWVMTNQFDLLQKGGFSQSIVVCIKENHLT